MNANHKATPKGKIITHSTEEAIVQHAEEAVAHHERIVLSERDFAAFVEAINSPAALPSPRLLADVEAYKTRHTKNNVPKP